MPDYDKKTGSVGTLRIRDTGTLVEFWILCSSATTFNNTGVPWTGRVNGTNVSGNIKLPKGFSPIKVASYTAVGSQTVQFNMGASQTTSLGGPTSHSAAITRATVPPAPTWDGGGLEERTTTSMRIRFVGRGNGGSTITKWELQRSTTSNFSANVVTITSTGVSTVTGLTPGTRYYWRARGVNAVGNGAWTTTLTTDTLNVPVAPGTPVATDVTNQGFVLSWAAPADNRGATISGYEVWIATNNTFTQNVQKKATTAAVRTFTFTGLSSLTTYYIRVFAKSDNGNSANSGVRTVPTLDKPLAPGAITVAYPVPLSATLSWPAAVTQGSTLSGYVLQLATNSSFTEGLQTVSKSVAERSHTFTELLEATPYYARVRATSNFGDSPQSTTRSFTTGVAPDIDPVFLKVAGAWKRGELQLKVAGSWRRVQPWIKVSGVWRTL